MSTTTASVMTADEFFEWSHRPENAGRNYELVRGEVVEMPNPGERHGRVCMNVAFLLEMFVRQRRQGYVLCNDTGVLWERDPDTVRGPDVVLIDENKKYTDLSPRFSDTRPCLVVEVLSPWDKVNQVVRRVTQFLEYGALVVWVIEPDDQTVSIYRPNQLPVVLDRTDELTSKPELPGFHCRVSDLFHSPGDEPPITPSPSTAPANS